MNYLLDTNIISELVAKHPNGRVLEWIDALDSNHVFLSVITIGELRKGIEKLPASARKDALSNWLTTDLVLRFSGRILPLDIDVMLTWGRLTGQLEQSGRPLPAIDSLIAALALHHNYTLVTRNEADFKDTGVAVINPWS
jgi:predicted nucleic acid-binding protein